MSQENKLEEGEKFHYTKSPWAKHVWDSEHTRMHKEIARLRHSNANLRHAATLLSNALEGTIKRLVLGLDREIKGVEVPTPEGTPTAAQNLEDVKRARSFWEEWQKTEKEINLNK